MALYITLLHLLQEFQGALGVGEIEGGREEGGGGGDGEGEREGEREERKYFEGMENGKEQQRQKSGKQGHTHSCLQTPAVSTWCGYYETFGALSHSCTYVKRNKTDATSGKQGHHCLYVYMHMHTIERDGQTLGGGSMDSHQ